MFRPKLTNAKPPHPKRISLPSRFTISTTKMEFAMLGSVKLHLVEDGQHPSRGPLVIVTEAHKKILLPKPHAFTCSYTTLRDKLTSIQELFHVSTYKERELLEMLEERHILSKYASHGVVLASFPAMAKAFSMLSGCPETWMETWEDKSKLRFEANILQHHTTNNYSSDHTPTPTPSSSNTPSSSKTPTPPSTHPMAGCGSPAPSRLRACLQGGSLPSAIPDLTNLPGGQWLETHFKLKEFGPTLKKQLSKMEELAMDKNANLKRAGVFTGPVEPATLER